MPLAAIAPFLGLGAAVGGGTLGTVVAVGSALAGLAGAGLDIAGNAESQAAENKTRAQENQEQLALQDKAQSAAATNIQASSPANNQAELNTAAGNRGNAWENLNQLTAPVASALPATGTSADTQAGKTASSTANTWNNLVSGAGARMGSYSDLATEQGLQDQNTAEQLGEINNFSQGDASLLPLEMDVASQKGSALSGWGSILSSLGSLTGLASQAGAFGTSVPQVPSAAANQEMLNEFNGIGAPGMSGGGSAPAMGGVTLPASNTPNFWTTIYS